MKMKGHGHVIRTLICTALLGGAVALRAEAGSISGVVVGPDGALMGAEVALTAFADKACLDLYEKKDPSQAEEDQIAACRKEKAHTVKTVAGGKFEFRDLPPAWYSILITWAPISVPQCGFPFMGEYLVSNYHRTDGTVVVLATGKPFELKAADKAQKNFDWCKW